MTQTQTQPRFQKGDLVKLKAKLVRVNRYKRHKDRVFTITRLQWLRQHYDLNTNAWHYDWLYTLKNWGAPDEDLNIWQPTITPVKLPKP